MTMKITSASFHACVVGKDGLPDDDLPIIALVGRSNVGKSSLINTLAGRKELARTSSTPGKTLTINFYKFNDQFYIVDLPGYGYAKASKATKKAIQQMMNEFFGECDRLKGIIQILDIRHKPSVLDINMFSWIRDQKYNYLAVLTKTDKLSNQQVIKMRKQILKELNIDYALPFSSKNRTGRNELLDALERIVTFELSETTIKKRDKVARQNIETNATKKENNSAVGGKNKIKHSANKHGSSSRRRRRRNNNDSRKKRDDNKPSEQQRE